MWLHLCRLEKNNFDYLPGSMAPSSPRHCPYKALISGLATLQPDNNCSKINNSFSKQCYRLPHSGVSSQESPLFHIKHQLYHVHKVGNNWVDPFFHHYELMQFFLVVM